MRFLPVNISAAGLILWTGPRHSGKSRALAVLVDVLRMRGLQPAGFIAPSIWREGVLRGFDLLDVRTGRRSPLARRGQLGVEQVGSFQFAAAGLAAGRAALAPQSIGEADLVLVDEFGPLEMRGGGWRSTVDGLLGVVPTMLLLVVRRELVDAVMKMYEPHRPVLVRAADPEAVCRVLDVLRNSRGRLCNRVL